MTTSAGKPPRMLADRVRFLTAINEALTNRDAVFRAVAESGNRTEAAEKLSSVFGWDELQARLVLDLQVNRWTKDGQASAATELSEATEALAQAKRVT